MGGNKTKECAHCKKIMRGCSCQWIAAKNGKLVHKSCRDSYETELGESGVKDKCAYCDKEFEGVSYFKAFDGRYVHFACQRKYEKEVLNKKNN
tara:strand:- start:49 stop:327 length:279 start_codon:yes stop_codon:yes gene_type:complete